MGKRGPKARIPARTSDCHPDRKYYSNGLCAQCYRQWYKKVNRVKYTAYERREYRLRTYGLSPVQFEQLLEDQGRACAICRIPFVGTKNLHIDHDHSQPGTHRSLLCQNCNVGLGHFREDPGLLAAAREYLNHWGQGDSKES